MTNGERLERLLEDGGEDPHQFIERLGIEEEAYLHAMRAIADTIGMVGSQRGANPVMLLMAAANAGFQLGHQLAVEDQAEMASMDVPAFDTVEDLFKDLDGDNNAEEDEQNGKTNADDTSGADAPDHQPGEGEDEPEPPAPVA